jgi:hypothetical protein
MTDKACMHKMNMQIGSYHGEGLEVEEVVRQCGDAMAMSFLLLLLRVVRLVLGPGGWAVVGVLVFFLVISLEALQDVPHGDGFFFFLLYWCL